MKILLASALSLIPAWAGAQDALGPQVPAVKMAPAPVVTVVQGKPATVPLSFRVASGYHINSNRPKSEFLIPTVLNADATTDIVIAKNTSPDSRDTMFKFAAHDHL